MRILLTMLFLCSVVQASASQCVSDVPPQAAQIHRGPELIAMASAASDAPHLRKANRGDMIKTTARGAPTMQQASASAHPANGEEHPRRTGPAMLLTALAVMSAIALRRTGASGR